MLKKIFLIIVISGLILGGQGAVFGQTTDKLKITFDVIGFEAKVFEIDFAVGPVPCPQEIKDWSAIACKAWDWLGLSIETEGNTFKLKIKNPVQEEIKLTDLPKEYIYEELSIDLVKIKIELLSGSGTFALQNPLQADTFQELVENIINFVWIISIVVAPLMILVAGFLFLTAAGRADQLIMARKMIFWTIIGFVVITLAQGIIAMLEGILGG